MHPILFHIGSIPVFTYGLMLSLAFTLALVVAFFNSKRHGVDPWLIIDMALWLFIAGLVGSRIMYVLLDWQLYADNPISVFYTWEGGVSFYGAIIGGFLVVLFFSRRRHFRLLPVADAVAPGLALAASVGRIGCFFNGCCYGLPTAGVWGTFTRFAPGLRYPTQLFESGTYFLIFLFLMWWQRSHAKIRGQLFLLFVELYLVGRFIVEFYREGERLYPWLTLTQAVSIGIFVVVAIIYVIITRQGLKAQRNPAQAAQTEQSTQA